MSQSSVDVWLVVRYSRDSWEVLGIFRSLKTAQEAVGQEKTAQEAMRAPQGDLGVWWQEGSQWILETERAVFLVGKYRLR